MFRIQIHWLHGQTIELLRWRCVENIAMSQQCFRYLIVIRKTGGQVLPRSDFSGNIVSLEGGESVVSTVFYGSCSKFMRVWITHLVAVCKALINTTLFTANHNIVWRHCCEAVGLMHTLLLPDEGVDERCILVSRACKNCIESVRVSACRIPRRTHQEIIHIKI